MKIEKIKEYLSELFVPRSNGLDGYCFRSEYMSDEHEAHAVYKAVSDAQFESGLTHGFSYEIGKLAADILAEADDWNNDDNMTERIDGAVPVYTHDLMQICGANSWAVDEAVEEFGHGENLTSDTGRAWYIQIRDMVESIKNNLGPLITDEE